MSSAVKSLVSATFGWTIASPRSDGWRFAHVSYVREYTIVYLIRSCGYDPHLAMAALSFLMLVALYKRIDKLKKN